MFRNFCTLKASRNIAQGRLQRRRRGWSLPWAAFPKRRFQIRRGCVLPQNPFRVNAFNNTPDLPDLGRAASRLPSPASNARRPAKAIAGKTKDQEWADQEDRLDDNYEAGNEDHRCDRRPTLNHFLAYDPACTQ